jgi:hypothetical protein
MIDEDAGRPAGSGMEHGLSRIVEIAEEVVLDVDVVAAESEEDHRRMTVLGTETG